MVGNFFALLAPVVQDLKAGKGEAAADKIWSGLSDAVQDMSDQERRAIRDALRSLSAKMDAAIS